MDPQAEALFQAPLFAALDAEAAAALRASMHEIKVERAQTLFAEGQPGDHRYSPDASASRSCWRA